MSIIVVEGVDASGKSTLLDQSRLDIRRRYFLLMRHSQRPYSPLDVTGFLKTLEGVRCDVVVDRHPLISEPIYGPILRGVDITENSVTDRLRYLKNTVERVIYCRPPKFMIIENLVKLPQLKGVKDNLVKLLEAYDNAMKALQQEGVPVIWYDYECNTRPIEDMFFGSPHA